MQTAKASSEANPAIPIFLISFFLFLTKGLIWRWRQALYLSSAIGCEWSEGGCTYGLPRRPRRTDLLCWDDSLAFEHAVKFVSLQIFQCFDRARRPTYL